MFTGLIRCLGTIRDVQDGRGKRSFFVGHDLPGGLGPGDSIAVNGVCLTVRDLQADSFWVDCYYVTLEKTTLAGLSVGDEVHLEPALRLGDALDGHLLQGHVSCTVAVKDFREMGAGVCLTLEMPRGLEHCFVPEGSVAIDGVSLTVAALDSGVFSVQLIGETLERTLLGHLKQGKRVNLETDFLLRSRWKASSAKERVGKGTGVKISVYEAARRLAAGDMVIITDNDDRENEGDLVGAARFATPEMINFMASRARGLICCAMERQLCERAGLPLLDNASGPGAIHGTRFCMPVDLIEGCTTGISAFDRSRTIMRLVSEDCRPDDFARPGHVFPIMEAEGSLMKRDGHTEASVYLARLGGLEGAAVICEMMDDDGEMVRGGRIEELAAEWDMGVVTVADIIEHMRVRIPGAVPIQTEHGEFMMELLAGEGEEHFCLYQEGGGAEAKAHTEGPLVRVHSECLTGDMLGSYRCDCGAQLREALRMINDEGLGYLIYLRQEGRGIGLRSKLKAYSLQDEGMDTIDANLHLGYPADCRDYAGAVNFLKSRGLERLRLLTNNPEKIRQLEDGGLKVSRVPLNVGEKPGNADYLRTKRERMGHLPNEEVGGENV